MSHIDEPACLQKIVNIIVKAAAPEKIFLLGKAYNYHTEHTIFSNLPTQLMRLSHYYLLVLVKPNDYRNFDALQDVIENRCRHSTPVTIFIEAVQTFNQWINTGHPFATRIVVSGKLIYDTERLILNQHLKIVEANLDMQRREFARWDSQINEFLAGTELYLLRKQFGLSAFLLHQATEHCCTILLKTITGYRASTHNLDKLFRYCSPFSAEIHAIFPRDNDRENDLFKLLQKAYVHGRYRDDFVITEKELRELLGRVKQLQVSTRRILGDKLNT